jgi:hypothetical protein
MRKWIRVDKKTISSKHKFHIQSDKNELQTKGEDGHDIAA